MAQILGRDEEHLDCFEHQPLEDARNQIRLIQIDHSNEGKTDPLLHLSIKSINREDARKHYRALSYRWGDAYPLHSIRINNKAFKVRQNLFEFLKYVSRKQIEDPTDWNGCGGSMPCVYSRKTETKRRVVKLKACAKPILMLCKQLRGSGLVVWS
jgi:hypothetical protein